MMASNPGGKRKAASAPGYEASENAANGMVAKGGGESTETIVALAAQQGIPVREDVDLAELLTRLDLGEAVPPELYQVVAEVLAWLHRVRSRKRRTQLLADVAKISA